MSDTKNLIAARKRDAQQRIAKYQEEKRKAMLAYEAAQEDLLAVEQHEAEEAAKTERAVSVAAEEPRLYTLNLNKRQVLDAIHLLGWNVTIPSALAKVDPGRGAAAYDTLKNLQQPLIQQFKAHYDESVLFSR